MMHRERGGGGGLILGQYGSFNHETSEPNLKPNDKRRTDDLQRSPQPCKERKGIGNWKAAVTDTRERRGITRRKKNLW